RLDGSSIKGLAKTLKFRPKQFQTVLNDFKLSITRIYARAKVLDCIVGAPRRETSSTSLFLNIGVRCDCCQCLGEVQLDFQKRHKILVEASKVSNEISGEWRCWTQYLVAWRVAVSGTARARWDRQRFLLFLPGPTNGELPGSG